jgi:hypothetical protein
MVVHEHLHHSAYPAGRKHFIPADTQRHPINAAAPRPVPLGVR